MPIPRDPSRAVFLRQLGFLEDPFRWPPDPRFMYLSSQHGPIVRRLQDVAERGHGLAVVDGPSGAGKSLLLRRLESFYRSQPDEYQVAAFHQPTFQTRYAMLLAIAQAFSLPRRKGLQSQQTEIAHAFNRQSDLGYITLLLLDDAHGLNPEALSQLDLISQDLAAVVLTGEHEIQFTLAQVPHVLSQATRATLTPLSLEDSVELIRFRCLVAGRQEPLFTEDALQYIWEAARGLPLQLILACAHSINALSLSNRRLADLEIATQGVHNLLSSPLSRLSSTRPSDPTR